MFEEAVLVSEALRQSESQLQGSLRMAMKGCPQCGATHMIASPELGICADCGIPLQVLESEA